KRVEHLAGERRPLPSLVVELDARDGLEQIVALSGDEHSLAEDAELDAFLAAAHQLAQSLAHDPCAAALVAQHPSPPAGPRLVAIVAARVRDRPGARDERDPDVEARGGQDEPGVVHHQHAGAGQQPREQLFEPALARGDLRARRAGAAGCRVRRSKLFDERGQAFLDHARIDQRDVGARRRSLRHCAAAFRESRAARASAYVETDNERRLGAWFHQVRVTLCSARGASGSTPRASATWLASSCPSTISAIVVSSSGSPLLMRTDDFASSGADAASNSPTTAQLESDSLAAIASTSADTDPPAPTSSTGNAGSTTATGPCTKSAIDHARAST